MTQESKNGVVRWPVFTFIILGIITFGGFAYKIRADALEAQFSAEDMKIAELRADFNKHIEVQIKNELQIANSLGRIEYALKSK